MAAIRMTKNKKYILTLLEVRNYDDALEWGQLPYSVADIVARGERDGV